MLRLQRKVFEKDFSEGSMVIVCGCGKGELVYIQSSSSEIR